MTAGVRITACLSVLVLWSLFQVAALSEEPEKVRKRKGMLVPPEFAASANEMKAAKPKGGGRDEPRVRLAFGPYQVVEFKRGWTRGSTTEVGADVAVVSGDAAQRYNFQLVSTEAPEEPPWSCFCAAEASGSTIGQSTETSEITIQLDANGRLSCRLDRAGVSEPWQLLVDHGIEIGLIPAYRAAGTLSSGDHVATIRGTDRLDRYPKIPVQRLTGFVLYLEETPVGAVDLWKPTVLLSPGLPDELRSPIMAAGAALLLFEDLTQNLGKPR